VENQLLGCEKDYLAAIFKDSAEFLRDIWTDLQEIINISVSEKELAQSL